MKNSKVETDKQGEIKIIRYYFYNYKKFIKKKLPFVLTITFFSFFSVPAAEAAKFVFLFIGDGMGVSQVNAAEAYLAGMRDAKNEITPRESQLLMTSLPVSGTIGTDSKSGVTDSAAAATAIATGRKTINNAVAMDPASGERYESIMKKAQQKGMKTGIVTSAFIQDATPAAFYAHAGKRTEHYTIGLQLAESGIDYFGGGGFRNPQGRDKKSKSLLEIAAMNGYRVVTTADAFRALEPGQKTLAIHPELSAGSIPWVIDGNKADLQLTGFVAKGIELLYGDEGFFMMVEGGKIDTACHANDALTAIYETMEFDNALGIALDFMRAHPDDTLIVVTADHETGGMAIDDLNAKKIYGTLSTQKGSYAAFERTVSPKADARLDGYMPRVQNFFGPSIEPTAEVKQAFTMSMLEKKKRPTGDKEYKKLYGPYDPLTMACIRQLNASAGITWTTFYHTGKRVPIWAAGAGAEIFSGQYENTGVFDRLARVLGL